MKGGGSAPAAVAAVAAAASAADYPSSSTVNNSNNPVLHFLQSLLSKYQASLKANPLCTKAVTSCVIALAGELIGSYLKLRKRRAEEAEERDRTGQIGASSCQGMVIDYRRLGIFGLYGLAITGFEVLNFPPSFLLNFNFNFHFFIAKFNNFCLII